MANIEEYAIKLTADSAPFNAAIDSATAKLGEFGKMLTERFKGVDAQMKDVVKAVDSTLQDIVQAEVKAGQEQIKVIEANGKAQLQAEKTTIKERTKIVTQNGEEIKRVVTTTTDNVKKIVKQASKEFKFQFPIDGVRSDLNDLSSLMRDFRTTDQAFNRKWNDANRKIREAGARGEMDVVRQGFADYAKAAHEAHRRQLAELKQAENQELLTVAEANAKRVDLERQLNQQLARVQRTRIAEEARIQERGPQQRVGQIQGGQIFANIGRDLGGAAASAGPLGSIGGMLGKIHPVALAATAGIGLLAAGFSKASAAGAELETGTARINSVLSGTQGAALPKEIGNLRKEAVATGIPIAQLQDGLYNVIGAVPALANNLSAATSITEKAAKTALGLGASTDSVAMAMTGLGNASGLNLESVENQNLIFDTLAKTMKDGVIPNGEALAGAIGKAAPTIAALSANGQLAVKSIGAMTAVLTGAGVSVDEAQTKIKALGNELLDSEKRATLLAKGVQGIDAATGKVTDFSALFKSAAAGGAELIDVFTSTESKDAIRIFTANGGEAISGMIAGFNQAGGTANTMFEAMANTAEQSGKRMDASINEFWLTVNDSIGASGITASLQSFAADAIGSLTEFLTPASQLFDTAIEKANELNQVQSTTADIAGQIGEAMASAGGASDGETASIFTQITGQMEKMAELSPFVAQDIQKLMEGIKNGSIDANVGLAEIQKHMEDISLIAEGNKLTASFEAQEQSIAAVNEVLDEATGWWDDIAEGIQTALNILFPFTNLISGMASMFGFDIGDSLRADTYKDMGADLEEAKSKLEALKAEAQGLRSDPQAFAEKMNEVVAAQKEVNKLTGDSEKINKGLTDAVKQQLDIQLQLLGGQADQIDKMGLAAQIASQFPDSLAESAGFQEQINKLVDEELAGAAERQKEKQRELDTTNDLKQIQAELTSEDKELAQSARERLVALSEQASTGDKLVSDLLQQTGLHAEVAGAQKQSLEYQIAELEATKTKNGQLDVESQKRLENLNLQLQKIQKIEFENQLLEIQNAKLVEQADLQENINQRLDVLKEHLGVEQLTNQERISGLKTLLAQNEAKIKQLEIEKQQAGLSKERQIQLEKELNVAKAMAGETKGQLTKEQSTKETRALLGTKDPVLVAREKKALEERIKLQEQAQKEQIEAQKKLDAELKKEREEAEKEAIRLRQANFDAEIKVRENQIKREQAIVDEKVKAEQARIDRERKLAEELTAIQKRIEQETAQIIADTAKRIADIRQSLIPRGQLDIVRESLTTPEDLKKRAQEEITRLRQASAIAQKGFDEKITRLEASQNAELGKWENFLNMVSRETLEDMKTALSATPKKGKEVEVGELKDLVTAVIRNIDKGEEVDGNLIALVKSLPENLAEVVSSPKVVGLIEPIRQLKVNLPVFENAVQQIEKMASEIATTREAKTSEQLGTEANIAGVEKGTGAVAGIKSLENLAEVLKVIVQLSEETEQGVKEAFAQDTIDSFTKTISNSSIELKSALNALGVDSSDLGNVVVNLQNRLKDLEAQALAGGTNIDQATKDHITALINLANQGLGSVERLGKIVNSGQSEGFINADKQIGTVSAGMEELIQKNEELTTASTSVASQQEEIRKKLEATLAVQKQLKEAELAKPIDKQDLKLITDYTDKIDELNKALKEIKATKPFAEHTKELSSITKQMELDMGDQEKDLAIGDITALEKEESDKIDIAGAIARATAELKKQQAITDASTSTVEERLASRVAEAETIALINDLTIQQKQNEEEIAKAKDEELAKEKERAKITSDAIKSVGESMESLADSSIGGGFENAVQGLNDMAEAGDNTAKKIAGTVKAVTGFMGAIAGAPEAIRGIVAATEQGAGMGTQAVGDLTTQIGKALLNSKNTNIQTAGAIILGIGLITQAVGKIINAIKGRELSSLEVAENRAKEEERARDAMKRQNDLLELQIQLGSRLLDQAKEQNELRRQSHQQLLEESELADAMSKKSDQGLINEVDKRGDRVAEIQAEIDALTQSLELGRDARKEALEDLGLDSSGDTEKKVKDAIARREAEKVRNQTLLDAAQAEIDFRLGDIAGSAEELAEFFANLDFVVDLQLDDGQFKQAIATQKLNVSALASEAGAALGNAAMFAGMGFDELQKAILALDFSQVSPEIQQMLNDLLAGAQKLEDIRQQELDDEQELIELRKEAGLISEEDAHDQTLDSLEAELAFLVSIHASEADILRVQIEINKLKEGANKEDQKAIENMSRLVRERQEFLKLMRSQPGGPTAEQQASLQARDQAIAAQLRENGASPEEIQAFLADLPAFSGGGVVPKTGMALVEKNEVVLTEQQAAEIRNQLQSFASLLSNPIAAGTDNLSRSTAQTIFQREMATYNTQNSFDFSGLSINLNVNGSGAPQATAKEVQKILPEAFNEMMNRAIQSNKVNLRQGSSL